MHSRFDTLLLPSRRWSLVWSLYLTTKCRLAIVLTIAVRVSISTILIITTIKIITALNSKMFKNGQTEFSSVAKNSVGEDKKDKRQSAIIKKMFGRRLSWHFYLRTIIRIAAVEHDCYSLPYYRMISMSVSTAESNWEEEIKKYKLRFVHEGITAAVIWA